MGATGCGARPQHRPRTGRNSSPTPKNQSTEKTGERSRRWRMSNSRGSSARRRQAGQWSVVTPESECAWFDETGGKVMEAFSPPGRNPPRTIRDYAAAEGPGITGLRIEAPPMIRSRQRAGAK
jgi:hypothetical protein